MLPITSPPIENGEVEVDGSGRIASVGRVEDVREEGGADGSSDIPVVDLGQAALLPGLINTHAHPELTVLRGSLEGLPFHAWIERIIRLKYEVLQPEELAASTRWGIAEAARGGVTSIGMIDDAGHGPEALRASGLRGICYLELFGPDPAGTDRAFEEFRTRFDTLRDGHTRHDAGALDRLRLGISPHSPYTVSAPLMERVLEFARAEMIPVSIHVAESADETAFVGEARGPLAERLAARGIEVSASGSSPVEWLADRDALDPLVLLAHCVRVSDSDIELLADAGVAVAHCPVSNAKLGHGIAPISALSERGVRVGIGSDSVATNNRVDLFAEARTGALLQAAASGDPGWTEPERWLRMLTLGGAEALGLGAETGSLEAGKWADLAVVDLAAPHLVPSPHPYAALLFAAGASDVTLTVVGGETVYRRDSADELFTDSDRTVVEQASRRLET